MFDWRTDEFVYDAKEKRHICFNKHVKLFRLFSEVHGVSLSLYCVKNIYGNYDSKLSNYQTRVLMMLI